MNIIRRQVSYVNLPEIRQRAEKYFPLIEYYLRETNLPEDLKYIPIVESGFINATSRVGAQGIWQFMPATASDYGLAITKLKDDRNDIYKSTYAACKVLADYYMYIRKMHKVSSWVLTAAAYNFGPGNISKNIKRQGGDYFSMELNAETAAYVYKIIAVKELFEYPELYIKNFTYNVFNPALATGKSKGPGGIESNTKDFMSMKVTINEKDGLHAQNVSANKIAMPKEMELKQKKSLEESSAVKLVEARIQGSYQNFIDGQTVEIKLDESLQVKNRFERKGNIIRGKGWIINDRVFVDLSESGIGTDKHDVILYDSKSKRGITIAAMNKNEPILLKVRL